MLYLSPISSAYQEPNNFPASVKRWTFGIGPEIYSFTYKEPGLMKDKGVFYGVAGAYTYRGWIPESPEQPLKADKWMFGLEGRFAYGKVDYDGALWDGTPYKVDNIDDVAVEFRMLLGPDFPKENGLDTIYAGIGYRYLNDAGSKDPAGYDRESTYCYIPVGLRSDRLLKNGWSFGATGEFDIFLVGEQKSHLSDIGFIDIENRQTSGYGLRGSVRFEKKYEKSCFKIEPFIRYWKIAESEDDKFELGVEPKNNTTEYGIQFIWTF